MGTDPNVTAASIGRTRRRIGLAVFVIGLAAIALFLATPPLREAGGIVNVSYDASRNFFAEFDQAFAREHPEASVTTTHAGSARQARAIINGLKADVVTLSAAADVDAISQKTGLIRADWPKSFPHDSSPFTSTIVFLVRGKNPRNVRDWDDLARADVTVVAPSPKVSGAGRWAYLAAWGYSLKRHPGDEKRAEQFVMDLYGKTPVLDEGARGALIAFLNQKHGDVLLTWENEARHAFEELGPEKVQIIYPKWSIRAEPVVAIVDRHAGQRETTETAAAYLHYLFSEQGQEIAARQHLRPRHPLVAARHAGHFAPIELFSLEEMFGNWSEAQRRHFEPGGTFDRIYKFQQLRRHSG